MKHFVTKMVVINFDIDNGVFKLAFKCIYSPNDGIDRKLFFETLLFKNQKKKLIYTILFAGIIIVL